MFIFWNMLKKLVAEIVKVSFFQFKQFHLKRYVWLAAVSITMLFTRLSFVSELSVLSVVIFCNGQCQGTVHKVMQICDQHASKEQGISVFII